MNAFETSRSPHNRVGASVNSAEPVTLALPSHQVSLKKALCLISTTFFEGAPTGSFEPKRLCPNLVSLPVGLGDTAELVSRCEEGESRPSLLQACGPSTSVLSVLSYNACITETALWETLHSLFVMPPDACLGTALRKKSFRSLLSVLKNLDTTVTLWKQFRSLLSGIANASITETALWETIHSLFVMPPDASLGTALRKKSFRSLLSVLLPVPQSGAYRNEASKADNCYLTRREGLTPKMLSFSLSAARSPVPRSAADNYLRIATSNGHPYIQGRAKHLNLPPSTILTSNITADKAKDAQRPPNEHKSTLDVSADPPTLHIIAPPPRSPRDHPNLCSPSNRKHPICTG